MASVTATSSRTRRRKPIYTSLFFQVFVAGIAIGDAPEPEELHVEGEPPPASAPAPAPAPAGVLP
jgi:hypothetical protein